MEGEICDLAAFVEVKKKYKCYLYLDEAHSIGAVGKTGRGVCEHRGVNPRDVDVLMGTFTKSFGAIGGYVAGSKKLISAIRTVCASHAFSSGLSPVCAAQVLYACRVIQQDEGKRRIQQLRDNSNLIRSKLEEIGLLVIGDYDSAVVPILIGHPAKIRAFSVQCLKRGVAIVVVGFPATPLLLARARFCLSAAHTKEEILDAVEKISEAADVVHIKYKKRVLG
jgi:serine palmitoyltransferase